MNIFITSTCPIESAKFLDNSRCNKMLLESAQMLSSALRVHGYTGSDVYKNSHIHHPVSKWVRSTRGNYKWLLDHFKALCDEYNRRTGKVHASSKLCSTFEANVNMIPEGELTSFVNCARNIGKGIDFTHIEDVTIAYQLYLNARWETDKREPTWS